MPYQTNLLSEFRLVPHAASALAVTGLPENEFSKP